MSFVDAVAVGSLPELTGGLLYDGTPRTTAAVTLRTTDHLSPAPLALYSLPRRLPFRFRRGARRRHAGAGGLCGSRRHAPAIVSARVGKGRAILSGVHRKSRSWSAEALQGHSDKASHAHVCQRLAQTGDARLAVFRQLLAHGGLKLG